MSEIGRTKITKNNVGGNVYLSRQVLESLGIDWQKEEGTIALVVSKSSVEGQIILDMIEEEGE